MLRRGEAHYYHYYYYYYFICHALSGAHMKRVDAAADATAASPSPPVGRPVSTAAHFPRLMLTWTICLYRYIKFDVYQDHA